jgi:hypothetical protein
VDHRYADLEASGVERVGRFPIEAGEGVPVSQMEVLEVELDTRVAVLATLLYQRRDGSGAGGFVGEQAMQQVRVESRVHD